MTAQQNRMTRNGDKIRFTDCMRSNHIGVVVAKLYGNYGLVIKDDKTGTIYQIAREHIG